MKKHYAAYAVVGILILIFGSVTTIGNGKCEPQENMPFLAKILQAFGIGKTNCSGNGAVIENSGESKKPLELTSIVDDPSEFGKAKTNLKNSGEKATKPEFEKLSNGNIRLKGPADMAGIAMPKMPSMKKKAKDAKPCAEDDVVCLEAEFDDKKTIDPDILDDGKTSAQFNCEEVEEKSGKETVKRQYCEGYIKRGNSYTRISCVSTLNDNTATDCKYETFIDSVSQ